MNPFSNPRRDFLRQAALLAGGALTARALPASADTVATARPLDELVTLDDAEIAAESVIPADAFAFLQGGAGDELTLRWNQERYREIRLHPRVLRDVSSLDTSTTLLGCVMSAPLLFAPTASNRVFHPEGEVAVARAANSTGTTYVLSTLSTTPVEEVARVTAHPLWFQVYVQPELTLTLELISRAEAAGARVICLTVDAPVPGARSREERARFRRPPGMTLPHIKKSHGVGLFTLDRVVPIQFVWDDVSKIIAHARVPVVLKGILHPDDAAIAVSLGAAGIIVSNHGGRQLDTVPATIEALPRVVDAVAGRTPILVDGGVRRGTDIVKALALGASAVLIGRPYIHGLAVGGTDGVAHVQRILLRELRMAMALLGCRNLTAIDRSVLWPRNSSSSV